MTPATLARAGAAACTVALLCVGPRVRAEVHPVGDEFVIAATGDKLAAAMDGLSRLVVAWRDYDAHSILVRRYAPDGVPLGPIDVVVQATGPYAQAFDVRVACGLDGSCAVSSYTDQCYYPDVCLARVLYAVYDTNGARIHDGWTDTCTHSVDEVAADPAGGFGLACSEPWSSPDVHPVIARLFGATGEPLGPAFHLSGGLGRAEAPRITTDSSGRYLVAWTERVSGGHLWHVAQRVSPAGATLGTPFAIDAYDAICGDAAGRIVTLRIGTDAEGRAAVFASRFGVDGTRQWGPAQVSQGRVASWPWLEARVACDASGGFVAAWPGASSDGAQTYVAARRYTASGAADGPEFQVNQSSESPLAIAIASDPRGDFTVLWRSTNLRARRFVVTRPSVTKGDIDGDGRTDLVLERASDGRVRVWNMSEAQRVGNAPLYPSSPDPAWGVVGVDDFNGDGHNDLLLRDHGGALSLWLLGGVGGLECLGETSLGDGLTPSTQWDVVATGDFTLDGWPDIVWQERATGHLSIWTTANGAYAGVRAPVPGAPADANWRVVAAQDFDGDGKRDLLFFNSTSGRLVQWLLDAGLRRQTGRFTNPAEVSDASWQVVAAGDYGVGPGGLPGTRDVVWRNVFSGRLVVWFLDLTGNRTAGTFTNPAAPSDPLAWTVVGPR